MIVLLNFNKLFGVVLFAMFMILISTPLADAFETEGKIDLLPYAGEPIHQDVTREGLYFLKDGILKTLADQHIQMEQNTSSVYHFDNCAFSGTVSEINKFYDVAVAGMDPKKPDTAKSAENFGNLLHPIQDFYSHSNWIELGRGDLIDPWLAKWAPIGPHALTTHDKNPVFSLEIDSNNTNSDLPIIQSGKKIVVHGDWQFPKVGLISGTYGKESDSLCPKEFSISHGGFITTRLSNAEEIDYPNELNKDHPKNKGHKAARSLAVTQTTHEFCRFAELVEAAHGKEGLDLLYLWVDEKYASSEFCPNPKESDTVIPPPEDKIIIPITPKIIDDTSDQIGHVIPPWIKTNADWWAKGLISDKDFAAGLGFMVKERIIQIDNVEFDPNGDIEISDNLQLPDWIENNARWWADGVISDDDFKSGIQFMVKEEVISFKEKPVNVPKSEFVVPDQIVKDLYTATVYQELTTLILLDIKNAEIDIYDDARKNAWKNFDDNNDIKLQDIATNLELVYKQTKDDAEILTEFLHEVKNTQINYEYLAKINDIPKIILEKEAELPLLEIDSKVKPDIVDDIISAYNDAYKSNQKTERLVISVVSEADDKLLDDFFTFGFENDGLTGGERIASEILRIESEESDDNTSTFQGTLEYIMINQINTFEPSVYAGLSIVANDPDFIILDDFIDDDTIKKFDDDALVDSFSKSTQIHIASGDDSVLIRGHGLNPGDTVNITIGATGALDYIEGVTVTVGSDGTFETTVDDLDEKSEGPVLGGEEGKYDIVVDVLNNSGVTVSSESFDFEIESDKEIELEPSPIIDALVDSFSKSTQIHIAPGDDSVLIRGHGLNPGDTVNITIGATGALDYIEGVTATVGSDGTFETTVDDLDEKSEGPVLGGEEGKYDIVVDVLNNSGVTVSSESFDFEIESDKEIESSAEPTTHEITALMISGGYFPIAQFSTWQWVGECNDANHYHSNTGHAISTTLQTLGDPDQNECGYGKVSEIPKSIINMSDEDVQGFIELTQIDPRNNEAMFGGSGP